MNSRTKIALVLGLIGLITCFFLLMDSSNNSKKTTSISSYTSSDWSKKYQLESKDPLGLSVFNSLLEVHLDSTKYIKKIKKWDQYDSLRSENEKATFLFIGQDCELLNSEIDTVLNSVNEGSDLVMSFYNLSENLYNRFFEEIDFDYDYADSIILYAGKKKLTLFNIYQTDTVAFEWEAFGDIIVADSSYTSLSSFMEMDNFIKIPHGNGNVYLHANPQFFFNYQVLRKDGFQQSVFFLDQISKNKNVYWLEAGRSHNEAGVVGEKETGGQQKDDSYFKLLFKHPSLMFAMLLIILGFILYIIFRAKRMRPIVPYIEKKKNMTLSFADTITSIYFAKESPKGLLKVQRKNFYNTIHKHFFIDLSRREGDKEIKILSEKSNVPYDEIHAFMVALENKKANDVTEKYITDIAQKQRAFYDKTGIISTTIQLRIGKHEKKYNRSLWLPSILILGGIFTVLLGFNLLTNAKGIGILLWPVGLSTIVLGILHLKKPLATISQGKINFHSIFGKSKTFLLEDLSALKETTTTMNFHFTQDRIVQLDFWLMSSFDKKQFKHYVSNLHKLEL